MKLYRFRLSRHGTEATKDIEAANPVSAINQLHRWAQWAEALKPEDYRVLSFAQRYHACAFEPHPWLTPWVEAKLDYPESPNPVLPLQAPAVDFDDSTDPKRERTTLFPFMSDY